MNVLYVLVNNYLVSKWQRLKVRIGRIRSRNMRFVSLFFRFSHGWCIQWRVISDDFEITGRKSIWVILLFLYHRNRRKRYMKRRKEKKNRTNEARSTLLHKYDTMLFIPSHHLFVLPLFVDNDRPSSSRFDFFLLSYLIFQYNYHSFNVIIIHPVQLTRKKKVYIHTHSKSIMCRSISRWICQIYAVYGLGR